jgi:hypothetical protein
MNFSIRVERSGIRSSDCAQLRAETQAMIQFTVVFVLSSTEQKYDH